MRAATLLLVATALVGCETYDYDRPRDETRTGRLERQESRRQADREHTRLCAMLDKKSERYDRDCDRRGGAN